MSVYNEDAPSETHLKGDCKYYSTPLIEQFVDNTTPFHGTLKLAITAFILING